MSLYLEKYENELSKKFVKNGYVILKKKNLTNLKYIRSLIVKNSAKIIGIKTPKDKISERFLISSIEADSSTLCMVAPINPNSTTFP